MVPLHKFAHIIYKQPKIFRYDKPIDKIVGFDSEAYQSGATFMFCTSLSDVIAPDDLITTLFSDKYIGSNFVVWNLKYESGAILKVFPRHVLKTLQQKHEADIHYKGEQYSIQYIPHKRLRIKHGKKSVRFWDMAPFYGRIKLEKAASDYLNEHKDDIDPTLFSVPFVEANFEKIAKYCVQDAVLTQKLADLWIDKFQQTGIPVTSLYSEASISYTYISRKTEIVTPWEYWDNNRKLIQLAFESYEGGKFEITHRGCFTGYEYDISSAYPYEISRLLDIRKARIIYSRQYQPDASYGFLRCNIQVLDHFTHLPCGYFQKLRIYPAGSYYLTITKQEYDYIVDELPSSKVKIAILDGAWLVINHRHFPYGPIMQELYNEKTRWKKKDRITSNNYKIVMNGSYGKMAQCLPDGEGNYRAGQGWNPLYASIVTANTRIAVTRLQNLLGDACLAVHTDSVISTLRIPDKYIGTGLGKFELVEEGKGILVACGIYEINGQCALKGFRKNSITQILRENPGAYKIKLSLKHVESWIQAMAQGHDLDKINLFSDVPKILTLNCDTKRLWPSDVNSDMLLNDLQTSMPLVEHQKEPPNYWKENT
jgi:hypothetical protein